MEAIFPYVTTLAFGTHILGLVATAAIAGLWSVVVVGRALARRPPLTGTSLWVSTLALMAPGASMATATLVWIQFMVVGLPALIMIAVVLVPAGAVAIGRRTALGTVPVVIAALVALGWIAALGLSIDSPDRVLVTAMPFTVIVTIWATACVINAWHIRHASLAVARA